MSLVDKPFKEAIRGLPSKRLSWWADRRIKALIRHRAMELDGRTDWSGFFKQLVAVPMALVMLIVATGGYAYASPGVVKGDLLYSVKTTIEQARYPRQGTSEDRIAYHLWLSERRYAEVNEILARLGKEPLVFIPAAQAAEGDDANAALHQLLLETLENASQHVDYAFLISDEIRDVSRVKTVQEQLKGSLDKQKEFVKKVTPVLKEVKLQQKKKSRLRVKKMEVVSEMMEVTAPEVVLPEPPVVTEEVTGVPEVEPVPEATIISPQPEEVAEEEIEDASALLEDRLAYQDSLLQQINQTLDQAGEKGEVMVVLRISVPFKPLEEDVNVADDFFRDVLAIHYQNSHQLLESDLQKIDDELVAQQVVPEETVVSPTEVLPEEEPAADQPSETEVAPEVETDEVEPEVVLEPEKLPEVIPPPAVEEEKVEIRTEEKADVGVESEKNHESESEAVLQETTIHVPEVCLKWVEERCDDNDEQEKCSEKELKECQKDLRKKEEREEKDRVQEELRGRADRFKQEIKGIKERLEELKVPEVLPETSHLSGEMKAGILEERKASEGKRR